MVYQEISESYREVSMAQCNQIRTFHGSLRHQILGFKNSFHPDSIPIPMPLCNGLMRTYVPAAPLETTETNPGKAEIGRMGKQFTSVAPSVDMSTGLDFKANLQD